MQILLLELLNAGLLRALAIYVSKKLYLCADMLVGGWCLNMPKGGRQIQS
jgi:hypothetical protein